MPKAVIFTQHGMIGSAKAIVDYRKSITNGVNTLVVDEITASNVFFLKAEDSNSINVNVPPPDANAYYAIPYGANAHG